MSFISDIEDALDRAGARRRTGGDCGRWLTLPERVAALARGDVDPPDGEPESSAAWLIYFDEHGIPPEIFTGPDATRIARLRFDQVKQGYNCHLFQRVERG